MAADRKTTSRPRLLLLNQYYWPGVEATAHLLSELCEALAEDFDVTVVTGRLRGRPELPAREVRNGVEIMRVASTAYDRAQLLASRARTTSRISARRSARGLAAPRPDVVLCMTDPPMIGDRRRSLVARRFRAPLVVISQDVFPEIAVALHRLENPLSSRLLGLVVRPLPSPRRPGRRDRRDDAQAARARRARGRSGCG